MKNNVLAYAAIMVGFCSFVGKASAHDCFKHPLEERYRLKTVSCKTCHPDNKDRSIHNKLGILFEDALKGKEMTKQFKEAEAKGDEAKAEYEKVMIEEFKKVLVEVEKTRLTLKDMIEFGLINGMRLTDEAEAEAQAALDKERASGGQVETQTSDKTDE